MRCATRCIATHGPREMVAAAEKLEADEMADLAATCRRGDRGSGAARGPRERAQPARRAFLPRRARSVR